MQVYVNAWSGKLRQVYEQRVNVQTQALPRARPASALGPNGKRKPDGKAVQTHSLLWGPKCKSTIRRLERRFYALRCTLSLKRQSLNGTWPFKKPHSNVQVLQNTRSPIHGRTETIAHVRAASSDAATAPERSQRGAGFGNDERLQLRATLRAVRVRFLSFYVGAPIWGLACVLAPYDAGNRGQGPGDFSLPLAG
eukprot:2623161-Prymnesium_polylepis.1